jgi:hypothetical protein
MQLNIGICPGLLRVYVIEVFGEFVRNVGGGFRDQA